MNSFLAFIDLFKGEMETPTSYGMFHIIFILFIVAITATLVIFFRNTSERNYRLIVFIAWILIVVMEIIKQCLYYSVSGDNYAWFVFPFQFCSTPLYALPFVIFLKDGKVRDAMIAFTGLFVLFAGIAVFVYPETVFCNWAYINHQTMLHHGSQVVIGIYTLVYYHKKLNYLFFLKALIPFACFAAIAILLDEIIPLYIGFESGFNMFFISRHVPCSLPILGDIYANVPYIIFLVIYLFGFALVTALINAIAVIINNLITKKKIF